MTAHLVSVAGDPADLSEPEVLAQAKLALFPEDRDGVYSVTD
jgi:hypothetical protein